jgi:transcriptional regulator with XRE-family HTH domain
MAGDEAHKRLSDWMEEVAAELDLSWEEVASRAGMSAVNLRRIRKGQDMPPRTKRKLERALQVDDGSIDAVLAGTAAPTPKTASKATVPMQNGPLAEILAASEDELDKMERLFERYRPGEGRTFRAWADGVRAAHTDGPDIVPQGPTQNVAG